MRPDQRRPDQLRAVHIEPNYLATAEGSTLIEAGNTRVLCTASVEESVPQFLRGSGKGWITAEYSMLPYSTLTRKPRDIAKGKIDGRSQEIQRLIGRAMRAAIDLAKLGPRTLWVDCDVLQADVGTRTAAITGGFVALTLAIRKLLAEAKLTENPLLQPVAAVSVGILQDRPLLDLCYSEDAEVAVDMNLVMNAAGQFIELQGSGEEATFTQSQLEEMLALGKAGVQQLLRAQQEVLAGG